MGDRLNEQKQRKKATACARDVSVGLLLGGSKPSPAASLRACEWNECLSVASAPRSLELTSYAFARPAPNLPSVAAIVVSATIAASTSVGVGSVIVVVATVVVVVAVVSTGDSDGSASE